MNKKSVLMVAAEASSTLYAQRILEAWRRGDKGYQCFGVGSAEMESLGFERIGKSEDMAVMGVAEVLEHYSAIKKVFYQILKRVDENPPSVAILLDYPGFNLRLAKELKKRNIPVVYYISPQIWAWKKNRVHQMRDYCDSVLLLFPFEVDFYKEHNVKCEFVGHPLIDEINPDHLTESWILLERQKLGIKNDEITLALMPGSRKSELDKHFLIQLEVAKRLSQKVPNLKILIFCAPSFEKEDLMKYLENFKTHFLLLKNEPFKMIAMADVVLAASGTATLMVGLLEKPMVIMYKMNWITGWIAKWLVKGVKFFGITNLILGHEVSPERFQEKANVEELERLVHELITDGDIYQKQRESLAKIKTLLGDGKVTQKVVSVLDRYIQRDHR